MIRKLFHTLKQIYSQSDLEKLAALQDKYDSLVIEYHALRAERDCYRNYIRGLHE